MIRLHLCCVAVLALLTALPENPARSAPVPKEKPALRLIPAGEVKIGDFRLEDGAVIDETAVLVVGTKDGPEEADPDKLDPNGAIVDLVKKTSEPFSNGHKARIGHVSISKGRVATASNDRDPVLRIWNLKTAKTVAEVEIDKPDPPVRYAVGWFHKSDRIAVAAEKQVALFDPAQPNERIEFTIPPMTARWTKKLVVSPDDAWMACTADYDQVVFWDVKTRKGTTVSLIPDKVDDPDRWISDGVAFGPKGTLIAWRTRGSDEVPEKTNEADVSADLRGVVQIELPTGKLVPLGMGHTVYTFHCAFDPTGTWLATVGRSRPDEPRPDGIDVVGELRVYHLPSKELAYREQLGDCVPTWVTFAPSGKRVVCGTYDGVVRWWDARGK